MAVMTAINASSRGMGGGGGGLKQNILNFYTAKKNLVHDLTNNFQYHKLE